MKLKKIKRLVRPSQVQVLPYAQRIIAAQGKVKHLTPLLEKSYQNQLASELSRKLVLSDLFLLKLYTSLREEEQNPNCSMDAILEITEDCPTLSLDVQLEIDRSRRAHPIFAAQSYMQELRSGDGSLVKVESLTMRGTPRKLLHQMARARLVERRILLLSSEAQFTTTAKQMSFALC